MPRHCHEFTGVTQNERWASVQRVLHIGTRYVALIYLLIIWLKAVDGFLLKSVVLIIRWWVRYGSWALRENITEKYKKKPFNIVKLGSDFWCKFWENFYGEIFPIAFLP